MKHAAWAMVDFDADHGIVWIEDECDANGDAKMSVTNDAEYVVQMLHKRYGSNIRIVYRDTMMEWWEIVHTYNIAFTTIKFKPWHGLEWDILSRESV